jgi:hypothetical protein
MGKRNNVGNTYTDASGKFAEGNPGKPKGARHKATQAVQDLLDGSTEALTQKAVDMALAGDTTALRLCLERICPARKDTPVNFELPTINGAIDAATSASAIVTAVGKGELTPLEGASVMGLVSSYIQSLEAYDFETRLAALEAAK